MKFKIPSVVASFRRTETGFVAQTDVAIYSNPVYKIASVATTRVTEGAEVILPEGYDKKVLENVAWLSGYTGRPFYTPQPLAEELAQIGTQLLELDKNGQIEPPLADHETESIEHLVEMVGQIATR